MSLLEGQRCASAQHGLPTDDKGAFTGISPVTGETILLYYYSTGTKTIDAGQAAGVAVVGKIANDNVRNELGNVQARYNDTSLSFTSTALTNERAFPSEVDKWDKETPSERAELVTAGFANGDFTVDYSSGIIYGLKASTQVSLTAAAYLVGYNTTGGGTLLTDKVDVTKVGGGTVPTVGSTPVVPGIILDDEGNQVTSFGSPSTIAEFKSPTDFAATYTSSTMVTLSALPLAITDSSQLVYIRVVPATGDAEVYTNGSSGVTMSISSNVLTISGAGTPFAAGDVYEIGVNGQTKGYDSSTDTNKSSVANPVYARYTDAETVVTAQDITAAYADFGAEIDCTGYKTLGV